MLGEATREAGGVVGRTIGRTRDATVRALREVLTRTAGASAAADGTAEETVRGELEGVVEETVRGALQAAGDAAADLGSMVKGAVIGAVEGVGTFTAITGDVLRCATRAAVRSTRAVNGDLAAASLRAIEAGTEAGEQAGLGHDEAALASADGVLDATAELDEATAGAVARAVSGMAAGLRALVEERLRRLAVLLVCSSHSGAEQLGQSLRQPRYDLRIATGPAGLDAVVQGREKVALVIIDLAGFDQAIWKQCARLQAAKVPFLLITDQRSPSVQKESVRHGARGVFTKPVGAKELAEYIRATLGR